MHLLVFERTTVNSSRSSCTQQQPMALPSFIYLAFQKQVRVCLAEENPPRFERVWLGFCYLWEKKLDLWNAFLCIFVFRDVLGLVWKSNVSISGACLSDPNNCCVEVKRSRKIEAFVDLWLYQEQCVRDTRKILVRGSLIITVGAWNKGQEGRVLTVRSQ